jgi:hypothetical protein
MKNFGIPIDRSKTLLIREGIELVYPLFYYGKQEVAC